MLSSEVHVPGHADLLTLPTESCPGMAMVFVLPSVAIGSTGTQVIYPLGDKERGAHSDSEFSTVT